MRRPPDPELLDSNPEALRRSTLPVSRPHGAGEPAPPSLGPGSMVKHYELVRELGRGGMGSVFLARDLRLARSCAIKFLLGYTGANAARFLAEARATARCRHDNIVTIYEVDEIGQRPYMVLEYLEGLTLRAWLAARDDRAPVSPGRATEIVIPVLRALVYAHEQGIVHGDLKPENLFLTDAGQVKVLDFGLATRTGGDDDPHVIAPGALIGTLQYMSPEQWLGHGITAQSDVWAIGVILHELVTGAHPLAPLTMARLATVKQLDVALPSAGERRRDVGPLGAVIDRCLRKRRAERLGSASELLLELEALSAGRTSGTRARPLRRRAVAALAAAGIAAAAAAALGVASLAGSGGAGRARGGGIAITDVPRPASAHPEARAAYDAALHGLRDANWTTAEDQLRRAIAVDPKLAAAHLRLAIMRHYTAGRVPDARQSYALAVQWRARLHARDRDILAAFEPLLGREPAELVRFTGELAQLARRRPDDAEVLALFAYFAADGPDVQLRAARRAVEIDPAYADAWQAVGKQLSALGRFDEARRAFHTCLAVSPGASDCRGERAKLHAGRGECAAAETDLRHASAANPHSRYWRNLWASSLIALGKPADAAIEVLRPKWASEPEARRASVELHERAKLALMRGRFDEARAGALALQQRVEGHADAGLHAGYATILIDVAIEAGRPAEAGDAAEAYLRRRDAWIASDISVDDIAMISVLRDTGRISPAEFDARRADWLARARDLAGSIPHEMWLAAWARPAATAEAARAALAAAPAARLPALARSLADHAVIGGLLLSAGRAGEARGFLERAARGCDGLWAPVAQVRASEQLGRALEATGDRAGACAAYQLVLARWDDRMSSTARAARSHADRLGCAR